LTIWEIGSAIVDADSVPSTDFETKLIIIKANTLK